MERARKLANRAILKRLVSQSKQSRSNEMPSSLYRPSRYVSSLSAYTFQARNHVKSFNTQQVRSISVEALKPSDTFPRRHNSATPEEQTKMAEFCGFQSLDALIDATVPQSIRCESMKLPKFDAGLTESQMIEHMQNLASKNKVFKSYIGMGYYNTYVPPVILRNLMENPAWYTQYTPYQAEISQGRLESLLNYQTMITDLTGLPMSNASLLDEGTAAAEAMAMCNNILKGKKKTFLIANNCHPQTIDICKTRADGFDLKVVTVDLKDIDFKGVAIYLFFHIFLCFFFLFFFPLLLMQVPMGIKHFQPLYITTFLIFLSLILVFPVLAVDPFTQALLSLKTEILDNSNSLSDWILPSSSTDKIYACSWSGVKCNQNSSLLIGLDLSVKNLGGVFSVNQFSVFSDLVELNLSHNSFSEKLPVGIFNLTNLRSLDISRNNFSGHFPSGISNLDSLVILDAFSNSFSGPLPKDVSEIESLKVLNFAGSYFSGPIPSEYGSFKNLDFIHLAGNSLSGKIPPELGMLKTVTHMEIGYNLYEGTIPWELGNMSKLQYLDIASANLSGSIPKELTNLTNLESLFLFRNKLSGKIPWEFGKIISLSSLDLSDNYLSGPIPESFSELKNLKLLSVMFNDLSGTVPEGIAKLPQLDTLLLWDNWFRGSLPKDLGKYSKLKYLDVSTNYLVGSIPPSICSGGVLQRLILFSNNFTGGLSPSLSNCSSLVRIRIEDNLFSGDISLNFSKFPDLSYVDMSRNRFNGGIPTDIALASNLEYFNVSNNPNLGGVISEKTLSLYSLQNFSATNCSISGDFPPFGPCKSLLVLELSMNNISGIFPQSISKCQNLVSLDLANNNLSGEIPVGLASLPGISVVDLSHNSFSGSIPAKFGSSSTLQLLNVSFNDLSGLIPFEKSFKVMDSSAFWGNPMLCGAPLRPCHGPNGLELGSRKTQKLAWVLITCGIIVLAITAAFFGVLYFRRRGQGQWKMVSFSGFPRFTANDVLRSFNSIEETTDMVPPLAGSDCKAVLPTGITVLVKKIEWRPERMNVMLDFILRMGNARHKNLTRLLGFCYNKRMAYLLCDNLPNGNLAERIRTKRDWVTKYKIIVAIAKGLCFLHHDCYPAIPHGDLKANNIVFDENMEPHLTEFGVKFLIQLNNGPSVPRVDEAGEIERAVKEELYRDIYNFGEVILEILMNGKLSNAATRIQNTSREVLLREVLDENDAAPSSSVQEEIKLVLEVASLCTRVRPSDRPSMEEALKLVTGLKKQG